MEQGNFQEILDKLKEYEKLLSTDESDDTIDDKLAEQINLTLDELNNEIYLLAMNDRKVIKLFKSEEPLTSDMSPFLIKKYSDCFAISYKQLNLSCDEQGLCEFTEGSIQPTEQLTTISY
jgi:hypothetical protein